MSRDGDEMRWRWNSEPCSSAPSPSAAVYTVSVGQAQPLAWPGLACRPLALPLPLALPAFRFRFRFDQLPLRLLRLHTSLMIDECL